MSGSLWPGFRLHRNSFRYINVKSCGTTRHGTARHGGMLHDSRFSLLSVRSFAIRFVSIDCHAVAHVDKGKLYAAKFRELPGHVLRLPEVDQLVAYTFRGREYATANAIKVSVGRW